MSSILRHNIFTEIQIYHYNILLWQKSLQKVEEGRESDEIMPKTEGNLINMETEGDVQVPSLHPFIKH